jgi:hypothetical protein
LGAVMLPTLRNILRIPPKSGAEAKRSPCFKNKLLPDKKKKNYNPDEKQEVRTNGKYFNPKRHKHNRKTEKKKKKIESPTGIKQQTLPPQKHPPTFQTICCFGLFLILIFAIQFFIFLIFYLLVVI